MNKNTKEGTIVDTKSLTVPNLGQLILLVSGVTYHHG
jgi:hypothetical protein